MAVLAVLLDHVLETLGTFNGFETRPFAWYSGRIGVLLFFVLTCLVLLQSLERSARAGRSSASAFYVRRAFRIYPLALVSIVAVLLLRMPPMSWESEFVAPGAGKLLANLTLTMNLVYSHPILSVLWSLPYELQMYAMLPVVFWCIDGANELRSALGLWLLGVAVALVQPELIGRLDVAQFAPCFLAGAVSFALARHCERRLPFVVLPLALAAMLASYGGIASLSGEVHPRWLGWALCLGVGSLLPLVKEPVNASLRSVCAQIAKYSYGIYLFHMIALWVGFNLLQDFPLALQALVAGALLVLLPLAGYHLVEKPGIEAGARAAERLRLRWNGTPQPRSARA